MDEKNELYLVPAQEGYIALQIKPEEMYLFEYTLVFPVNGSKSIKPGEVISGKDISLLINKGH